MKLPRLQEIAIVRVSNGFIVKVIYDGESNFKEPYDDAKPVVVFSTILEVNEYLRGFF